MITIRLGTFTPSVLLDVCRRTGTLEQAGLAVEEILVPSSPAQFTSLEGDELDAVFTSPDNVIAYRFVPGNPLRRLVDVSVVAALDRGLGLSVWTAPPFPAVEQVRGAVVGVDVPTSGFAFVAYELLGRLGLARDAYTLKNLGATPKRADALAGSSIAATVLNAGNELRAESHGCHAQLRASEIGPYLGTVLARRSDADQRTRDGVDRLADALLETASAVLRGHHDDRVTNAATRLLGLSPHDAVRHLACLRDPREGLVSDGIVDRDSIGTLVSLRTTHLPSAGLSAVLPTLPEWVLPRALGKPSAADLPDG
jgi:ABC-type nitrate/sulfonate/bicarbonate transport system substrate-binding protein